MAEAAILGYGVVGGGIFEVLTKNAEVVGRKAGQPVKIKKILDLRDFPGDPAEKLITHNIDDILNDDMIEVVAETMGGISPAYEFTKAALERGKSVVTSNKELVALHGAGLLAIAKENSANYLFEASVGGGIPIIRPLNTSLCADDITEIIGILNGTTNFILTKMERDGENFNVALKAAQDLGYAEKNPEADVEGKDACRKLAILMSLAGGRQVDSSDIYTEGITRITALDMNVAAKYGGIIKLIARGEFENGKATAKVTPAVISQEHPLAVAEGVFNAIMVKGNAVGDIMFYGEGAGKMPTASAVASDIIDAVKHKGKNIMQIWEPQKRDIAPFLETSVKKLIIVSYNGAEAFPAIQKIFGVQKDDLMFHSEYGSVASFRTGDMTEGEMSVKIKALSSSDGIEAILNDIRVY